MKTYLRRLWLVVFLLGILLPANASVGEARSTQADMVLPTDWTATGAMNARRAYFTLSVLPDGTALAAGGYYHDGSPHYLNSSEIYDPLTNTWAATDNNMTTARRKHTATVLLDGRVLVAGGESNTGTETNTAEIYDPATGLWTATGSLNQKRYGHTATRLQDGRVLVVGGCFRSGGTDFCTVITEIYDPASGTWNIGTPFATGQARMNHTATLLQDGSVLVAGGYRLATVFGTPSPKRTYNSTYRLFPGGTEWVDAGTMTAAPLGRSEHSAVVRRDGKVLIVGGYYYSETSVPQDGYLASTEVYDPGANSWSNLSKPLAFGQRGAPAVLDANGNFILLGGEFNGSSSDVYYMDINNLSDTWHRQIADLPVQRSYHAAAVLPGGVILVAGGRDVDDSVVNSAETNRFTIGAGAAGDLRSATFGFYSSSATLMPNGNVMITGGAPPQGSTNPATCHNLVSFWDFEDDTFPEPGPAMNRERCNHSTILLPDGRVLVLGGMVSTSGGASGTGEIYDGTSWTRLTATGLTFEDHKAVLLPNGTVFVMEGSTFDGDNDDAYIFNPVDLSFRKAKNQPTGNYSGFTLTLMGNGKVLILGSQSSAVVEVFDSIGETFTIVPHPAESALFNTHEAVLLPDGDVLVTGGRSGYGSPMQDTYFFTPGANDWENGPKMILGRRFHQMLVLPDGRPVVIGGATYNGTIGNDASTTIEIFDPADDLWHSAGDMFEARRSHEALLTLTGKILIIGGMDDSLDPIASVERFNFPNISTSPALWQPTVTDARCVNCNGNRQIELTGSDFTEAWEGSGGLTNQSAANQPLVQIIRLDNGQMEWLRPGEASSDGRFLSAPIPNFPDGPAMVFVYVNGSFQGKVVMISGYRNKVYLPMLRR